MFALSTASSLPAARAIVATGLTAAAFLAFAIGVAHSYLGERFIISPILRRKDLPKIFGSEWLTKRTLRFAWHLTTLAWWGFAAQMFLLASAPSPSDRRAILLCISLTFAASAVLSGTFSRGKHFSWIVFLVIAALCWLAA